MTAWYSTDVIKDPKASRYGTELKSFSALYIAFRQSLSNCARIDHPLNYRQQKNQPFIIVLNQKELKKMKRLQQELISPAALAFPCAKGRKTLSTDACDFQVGFILLQEKPDRATKPNRYWSRSPSCDEIRFDTTKNIFSPWSQKFYEFHRTLTVRVSQSAQITTNLCKY